MNQPTVPVTCVDMRGPTIVLTHEDRDAEDFALVRAVDEAFGVRGSLLSHIAVGVSPLCARNVDAQLVIIVVSCSRLVHPLFWMRRAKIERALRALVGPETRITIEVKGPPRPQKG